MSKLKIEYRVYSKGRGNPTESYILTDDTGSRYRVTLADAIELCKQGCLLAKHSASQACLQANYNFKSVKFEDAKNIGYIKANDLIKLMILNSKSKRVSRIVTKRTNNKGTILADAAIIDTETNHIVGYIFSDGTIADVKNIPNGYQKQIVQIVTVNRNKELKTRTLKAKLRAEIDYFKSIYANTFDLKYVKFNGKNGYIRIPLDVKYYQLQHANCMIAHGDIKKIVFTDNIEKLKRSSDNIGVYDVANMLGYNVNCTYKSDSSCYIYNDDVSFKGFITIGKDSDNFEKLTLKEKADVGIVISNDNIIIYDTKNRKTTSLSKKTFYRSILIGDIQEIENLKLK